MNRKRRHFSARDLTSSDTEAETIWQTLSRITVTLIIVAGLGVALTFFIPEIERQKALSRDIDRLERQRQVALENRDALRKKLRWLNDDREYLEIMARDRLDLYREGETILRIDDGDGDVSSSSEGPFADRLPTG